MYVTLKGGYTGGLLLVSLADNMAKNTTKGSGEDNEAAARADLVMTSLEQIKRSGVVL